MDKLDQVIEFLEKLREDSTDVEYKQRVDDQIDILNDAESEGAEVQALEDDLEESKEQSERQAGALAEVLALCHKADGGSQQALEALSDIQKICEGF